MALGETAVLAVELKLNGVTAYTSGITQAEAATTRLGTSAGTKLPSALSLASRGVTGFGNALGHAKSAIGNLVTGPLGLIGLTGGLLTVGGAIEKGISRAEDFGLEVSKLQALTGGSVETISALAAAFEHFGLSSDQTLRSIGFLEKNVGLLASRKGALVDFEKSFGFALTDTNGHIKDANALLLTAADYFNNKLIPSTTKAAALAKLFGRSWQDLIPLLSAGSAGIKAAEEEAAALGLTLTRDNLPALMQLREATRTWGDALGGLELQIGLALVPELTKLAQIATGFVRDNRTNIVAFFKDAAHFAEDAGRFIGGTLIPAIRDIGSAALGAWDAIPGGLKDLLIKGFVANKTVKVLFGVDIAGDIGKALEGAVSKGLGAAVVQAGIGKAFVQPVFVTNPGFGGLPGAAAGAGEAAAGGELAAAGGAAAVLGPLAVIAGATVAIIGLTNVLAGSPEHQAAVDYASRQATAAARGGNPNAVPYSRPTNVAADVYAAIAAARQDARSGGAAEDIRDLKAAVQAQTAQEDATHARLAANSAALAHNSASVLAAARDQEKGWSNFPKIIAGIEKRSAEKYGGTGLGKDAVMATYNRDILRHAARIMKSTEAADVKLARLQALYQDVKNTGDAKTRAKLAQEIELLKSRLSADTKKVGTDVKTAVKDQKPPVVNVKTVTNVTWRGSAHVSATGSSYTSVYTGRTGGSRPA